MTTALTKSARKRLKEKARKGRRAAEAAGEPEVAPSPAPPPVFKTLREKKAAQASAEGWAAEVARAEELYEELRERAPQHCRRGGKWAREKFVMAVQGEFPRARGRRSQGDDPVPRQGARRARGAGRRGGWAPGLGGGPARVRHQPDAAPRHVHGVRVNAVHAARAFWCTPFVPRPVPPSSFY